jgi:hypothetical protein
MSNLRIAVAGLISLHPIEELRRSRVSSRRMIAPGAFVLISRKAAPAGLLDDCDDGIRIAAGQQDC